MSSNVGPIHPVRRLTSTVTKVLANRGIYIVKSLNYKEQQKVLEPKLDYIRYASLELCYEEIIRRNVPGAVAEVGVYQGEFATRLNRLFNDRKLYLFDTFEGFDNSDISIEAERGFSSGKQDFSRTGVEFVLNKMYKPENCIIKKGFFPATAEGVTGPFCFVSLDADLYAPIYAGLQFFYPLLAKGGYMFIHDFNNDGYKGAKEAVLQYCSEQDVTYTPIADSGGTVIIAK